MIIAGGCYGSSIGSGRKFLNDVWASTDGISWEQLAADTPWAGRSGPRLLVFNDKLMLIAGERGFTPDTQLQDIWTSADGKEWQLLIANPAFSARSGHGVIVKGNQVFVIAGWNDNKCLHDMWSSEDGAIWKLVSNTTWKCAADSCGMFDFWTVLLGDKIVTVGGSSGYTTFGKMSADTWELSIDSLPPHAVVV